MSYLGRAHSRAKGEMDYGPEFRGQVDRQNKERRRWIATSLLILVLGGAVVGVTVKSNHDVDRAPVSQPATIVSSLLILGQPGSYPHDLSELSRPLYPYSIIPGGVESAAELRKAVANDPVVAAHYTGFDLAKARVIRLTESRTVYVSYRKGDDVFWTSKVMRLAKGEAVITDGGHTTRLRCGNQISEVPRAPVARVAEPRAEMLETPLLAELTPSYELPLVPPLVSAPFVQIQTAMLEGTTAGSVVSPIVPLIGGIGGGTSVSPLPSLPSAPVPEPTTPVLISTGLGAVLLARKMRKN
jgi:hypothetical protein